MSQVLGIGWFFLLAVLASTDAQKKLSKTVNSQCLGNILRVDVAPLRGKLLEVVAVVDNSSIPLTPSVASQCGFSVDVQWPESAVIYASLLNCFARSADDKAFTTTLRVRLLGNEVANDESYRVVKTCLRSPSAYREIVCERNYVEVSVKKSAPRDSTLPQDPTLDKNSNQDEPRHTTEQLPIDAGFQMTTVVFFTPAEKAMAVAEARGRGYGIANTDSRLVLRSPMASPEMYTQNVAGVHMDVLRTSTVFQKNWLSTQIDAVAACPTLRGSVSFSPNTILWALPWHIDPLISSEKFELLEVHLSVDGQRLEAPDLAARKFSLNISDAYVIVEIPVGADGGSFQSHVQDGLYFTSYTIEPLLELLWAEDSIQTRYTVLFPITTPPMPQNPHVLDNTVPVQKRFKFSFGPFAADVVLLNISFPTAVLSVSECISRGFQVVENMSFNRSSKYFDIQIPFKDPVVQQMSEMVGRTTYFLHMTFVLMVMPVFAPFSLTAHLQATWEGIVPPSISVDCGDRSFRVLVQHGSQGQNFQTMVGQQRLTAELAWQYGLRQNATHFHFRVPFYSSEVVFEAVEGSNLKTRLYVALSDLGSNKIIQDISMTCDHSVTLTECFPNGTITAWALKLESVPSLDPSKLVLNDPTCGPSFSDDRSAYFVFAANSCGTTRKFVKNMMLYENEISLPDDEELNQKTLREEPEYEMRVACYYNVNQTTSFRLRQRRSEPYADNARGELLIEIRLATDGSYSMFYNTEDYPLAKYLQEPLYFEVELMGSKNPQVSLELENCWATLGSNRTSQPRWNLIINGCANPVDPNQVIFHPVWVDGRVQHPSHYKRFEAQMFAFAEDDNNLKEQIFVHCDVVICDLKRRETGACNRQCPRSENKLKGQRRSATDGHSFIQGSFGPIHLS
ncbi:uncharacterized protein LOC142879981 [Nelusetta ayraudi]|uniref:uncharacterized protein LOC142879981 n=1 Tax=Nelusetta ayraudi TaxID=303726 RepID=UPI003F6FCC8A